MDFKFTRNDLSGSEHKLERFLEAIPALISWSILIVMTVLSFTHPLPAAVIIIAFDLYWIMRLFYMNIFLVVAYMRLSIDKNVDWMARVRDIDELVRGNKQPRPAPAQGIKERLSLRVHLRRLRELRKSGDIPPASDSVYHLVIFPVAREGREIVEPAIASLINGSFPASRMIVIISVEEHAAEEVKEGMRLIRAAYHDRFCEFLCIEHPQGREGEARVKGANASFAARYAARLFEEKKIPFDHVIVSCFDADTVAHADYFSCLTYTYLVTPSRDYASFQPIPVYHNNIWDAPGFARVLDVGASFFQMIEATNPDKLVTFSSHSMSFKALVEVGYWPVDLISDDSAIFWKAFIHYDGNYTVVPLAVTLSMDIAVAQGWWSTIVNVYKQKRRWAWGVENFPIVMRAFLRNGSISFYKKLTHGFKLFEGHVAWASWPFLLTVVGWLPALFAGREFAHTTVYYSAPRITLIIFRLASVGLLTCIILSILLLPPCKSRLGLLRKIAHALEWIFVPVVSVFLNGVPALDAQTRLALGKYMEFWVTVKGRR